MEEVERILDIRVNYGDAIKKIAEYKEAVSQVDLEEKKYQKQLKLGEISQKEYLKATAALKIERKQYTDAIRVLNKEVDNELKKNDQNRGSLKALRAELSNLTKAYDEMSREERESASGKELQEHIMEVSNEIKQAEYATNRFYRNVGNYPKEVISLMRDTYAATGSLSKAMGVASTSVGNVSKSLLKLLANPVVAFFAAIAAVTMGVVKVFSNSEERTNRLRVALAAFEPILNGIKNLFGALADVVVGAIEKVSQFAQWMGSLIGISDEYNESVQATINLEKERQALVEAERKNMVQEAQMSAGVSKLRNEIAQKDKYTLQERLMMLDTAIRIEEGIAKKRAELARENLRILEEEARMTENDAEMNNKLAEAKRAVIEAEAMADETTRRMQAQRAAFIEEEKRDEEARRKAASDAAKQRKSQADAEAKQRETDARDARQKELKALQDAEDAMLALVGDTFQRQYEQRRIQGEREIEALRERLETEKNLTAEAREAINQTILAKEKKLGDDLSQMQAEQEARLQQVEDEAKMRRSQEIAENLQLEIEAYEREVARKKELADEEVRIQQEKMEAIGALMGNLSSLFERFGEDNRALAKLSKVLALGEIAVNTGKAIAAGVAQAQSAGPFPANLAAIATTVATVVANMATALSAVKGAKFAAGGDVRAYAGGGSVTGPGTGTSDSIAARLSNGESVNTALATAMFGPMYSAMNQMGGGNPINGGGMTQMGEAMLARAFAAGAAMLPRPVVSVEEVTTVQRRVETLESLATI